MNYLEFPDGSLFWQQTTYLRGINMSSYPLNYENERGNRS